jgi:hypothetical protein
MHVYLSRAGALSAMQAGTFGRSGENFAGLFTGH